VTERQAPEDGRVRLSKLMSERGLSSRREADDWIAEGWVSVDGELVTELGTRVWPNQTITVDAMAQAQQAQRVTIVLNKPIGYVSGQAEDGHEPAVVLITPDNRWSGDTAPWKLTRGHLNKLAPAGRLDIDSTGMLVFTQDGRIARHLIGEDALVEKEYLVRVVWMAEPEAENVMAITPPEAIQTMQHGLWLDDKPLKPAKVSWQNEQQLRVVLREGKKRQIRRMCELVGLKVVGLKRVRMGKVVLGKLPLGQWRFLRPDEEF
jgi:23S rRNA pseudouridine2604 synthase